MNKKLNAQITSSGGKNPSRRRFVSRFVLGTASTMVGTPWIGTLLATLLGQGRAVAANSGELNLNLTSFPALLEPYGSVRISINSISGGYPSGEFFPLIVSRETANTFYAVSSQCTHRGCIVQPFDGNRILCPCHDSEFGIDGTVTRGPATLDLPKYAVSFDGVNTLKITVPGLGYSITRCTIETGARARIRLEFPTFNQVEYEVLFRETVAGPWGRASFATTLDGPADTMVLMGDGLPKAVFVDPTAAKGFYCVSIRFQEV